MKLLYSILLTLCLVSPVWADGMIISTVASGLIGNSGSETGTLASGTNNRAFFTDYTTTTPGIVSYAHIYISSAAGTEHVCVCLWNTSGTKLTCSASTVVPASGWLNVALESSYEIATSTTYWVGAYWDTATITFSLVGASTVGSPEVMRDNAATCGSAVTNDGIPSNRTLKVVLNNQSGDPL